MRIPQLAGTHACHDQGGFVLDTRQAPLHQSPKRAQNSRHSKKRSFCHTPYIANCARKLPSSRFPQVFFFRNVYPLSNSNTKYFFARDRGFHSISFHCFFFPSCTFFTISHPLEIAERKSRTYPIRDILHTDSKA